MNCEGCGLSLTQPYRLPCTHYIGECCRNDMFNKNISQCPVDSCDGETDEEYEWSIDRTALEHRYLIYVYTRVLSQLCGGDPISKDWGF